MPRRLAIAFAAIALAAPAHAQLIAEQNGASVEQLFAPHGFTDVEIVRRTIDHVEAEACRDNERWRITLMLLSGRVKPWRYLGSCGPELAADRNGEAARIPPPWSEEDAAMRALEAFGYTGVKLRKWGREGWRGTACRGGSLREVRVSVDGRAAAPLRAIRPCPPGREVERDLTAGPPEPPIRSVRDVKARLVARGYTGVGRIEIKDGALHAIGCEGAWRFQITVLPNGEVRGRTNLGRCETDALAVPVVAN